MSDLITNPLFQAYLIWVILVVPYMWWISPYYNHDYFKEELIAGLLFLLTLSIRLTIYYLTN